MGDFGELFGPNGLNLQNLSPPVQIALMLGLSVLLPAALMTATLLHAGDHCTRVRAARTGDDRTCPPNMVITGLSLFLTLFIMQPTFTEIDQQARAAVPEQADHRPGSHSHRHRHSQEVHAAAHAQARPRAVPAPRGQQDRDEGRRRPAAHGRSRRSSSAN